MPPKSRYAKRMSKKERDEKLRLSITGKMKVLYPIEVPIGNYCWDYRFNICEHYDNEGGHPTCSLGFRKLKVTAEGVLKPAECMNLVSIGDDVSL